MRKVLSVSPQEMDVQLLQCDEPRVDVTRPARTSIELTDNVLECARNARNYAAQCVDDSVPRTPNRCYRAHGSLSLQHARDLRGAAGTRAKTKRRLVARAWTCLGQRGLAGMRLYFSSFGMFVLRRRCRYQIHTNRTSAHVPHAYAAHAYT